MCAFSACFKILSSTQGLDAKARMHKTRTYKTRMYKARMSIKPHAQNLYIYKT